MVTGRTATTRQSVRITPIEDSQHLVDRLAQLRDDRRIGMVGQPIAGPKRRTHQHRAASQGVPRSVAKFGGDSMQRRKSRPRGRPHDRIEYRLEQQCGAQAGLVEATIGVARRLRSVAH